MKKYVLLFLFFGSVYATDVVPTKYYSAFSAYCTEYGVPEYIMARLITYESGWNPKHINKNKNGTKDFGLCQLNSAGLYDLARWHNKGVAFDPMDWKENLRIGTKHLRYLYQETGSWWSAVAAYNMGMFGFSEWVAGRRKLPETTRNEMNFVFK